MILPDDANREIRERDGHKCQICGKEEWLHVHHINPIRIGGDNSPENLITLCPSCHKKEDLKLKHLKTTIDNYPKQLMVRMDIDLFKKVKIYCIKNHTTIQDFITNIIKKLTEGGTNESHNMPSGQGERA